MPRVNRLIFAFAILCFSATSSAGATYMDERSGQPYLSIGISLSSFPDLRVVPGYPVYYAPRLEENYFFYDGMYWVYRDDGWYSSAWYDGPWWATSNEDVPLYILRIPVRYYRRPPKYFHGWLTDSAPRWGDHWGRDWAIHRSGWDTWNRSATPRPAPLPTYQKDYSGDRYPRQVDRQRALQQHDYRYEPRDPVVRKRYQRLYIAPAPSQQKLQGQQTHPQKQKEQKQQLHQQPQKQQLHQQQQKQQLHQQQQKQQLHQQPQKQQSHQQQQKQQLHQQQQKQQSHQQQKQDKQRKNPTSQGQRGQGKDDEHGPDQEHH